MNGPIERRFRGFGKGFGEGRVGVQPRYLSPPS